MAEQTAVLLQHRYRDGHIEKQGQAGKKEGQAGALHSNQQQSE
jgi:hypothetical protein